MQVEWNACSVRENFTHSVSDNWCEFRVVAGILIVLILTSGFFSLARWFVRVSFASRIKSSWPTRGFATIVEV